MQPVRPLKNRTALVTGAGKRLGRAIAQGLAAAGANVVVHYNRSEAEAAETVRQVEAKGVRAWGLQANLAEPDRASEAFARGLVTAGPIDILVNSASIFPEDRLVDFTGQSLFENIQINAFAPLVLSRAFAAQSQAGSILNLLDARIADYDKQHVAYHLSKRMLHSLTCMMALEFAPSVRVNGVAPGLILPPEDKDAAYLDALAHTNLLNAVGDEQDIVDAVLFLTCSKFVTGQVIFVDGGRHLSGNVYGA